MMGLRRPSLCLLSTKPRRRPFRFAYRIPPTRYRHDTGLSWNFRGALSAPPAPFRSGGQSGPNPTVATLRGTIGVAPRKISAVALNRARRVTFAAKWLLCARVLRFALVAQLDRASDFESEGREFESLRARQTRTFAEASFIPLYRPCSQRRTSARFRF